jgi:hypothetical protein
MVPTLIDSLVIVAWLSSVFKKKRNRIEKKAKQEEEQGHEGR